MLSVHMTMQYLLVGIQEASVLDSVDLAGLETIFK